MVMIKNIYNEIYPEGFFDDEFCSLLSSQRKLAISTVNKLLNIVEQSTVWFCHSFLFQEEKYFLKCFTFGDDKYII